MNFAVLLAAVAAWLLGSKSKRVDVNATVTVPQEEIVLTTTRNGAYQPRGTAGAPLPKLDAPVTSGAAPFPADDPYGRDLDWRWEDG